MRMGRTTSRRRLNPGVLLLLIVFMMIPAQESLGRAGQQTSSPEAAVSHLHEVEQQIKSHRGKITETHIQALNLMQEMNRITSQIKKGQDTQAELEDKLRRQEGLIRQKETEMAAIQSTKEMTADHVRKRLAAFYQTGEVGIINALFSSADLGDLLDMQEYVKDLFQYDQQVLKGFRDQIALLARAKDDLTQARRQLQSLVAQVQEGEQALVKSRAERNKLLDQVRAEEQLYRRALKELNAAAAKLAKTISHSREQEAKLDKKKISSQPEKNQAASISRSTGFAAHQGKLPPPAKGRIIRAFGPYKDPFGTELQASGVDLAIPPATIVRAIHDGRIIFSGQMPGYGNLVIIDHGSQYYSLVSGLESLAVKKDARVITGEAIGTFGQATGLINPGLHIEIRHGTTPVDPLLWLDRSQLQE
jgi:septal ring factor EnvC (AmiA/AmiB activator)